MTACAPDALMQNKTNLPPEFDRIARRYDLATLLSQGYRRDLQTSVDRMHLKGNELLADLCCGTGTSTIACLSHLPDGTVIAIDNSAGMLQAARKKLAARRGGAKVRFLQQDVMHLTLHGVSLDAIFMAYGIRNMPDVETCIHNLYRILKPGGKICFHEYAIKKSFLSKLYWKLLGYCVIIPFAGFVTGSTTLFRYLIKSVEGFLSPEEFADLLQKAGFENITHAPLGGWRKPILHTFLAQKPLSGSK